MILCVCIWSLRASLLAQRVKNSPAMQETQVPSLDWEDPLEKEMATCSSILAWRIPWTDRGAQWAINQGFAKELDTTKRLNDSNNLELGESQVWWFSTLADYQNHLREHLTNARGETSLVAKWLRLCFYCRGPRFNPWSGN